MRKLALLPLLALALSCNEGTVLQPDRDLPIAASATQASDGSKIVFKSFRDGNNEIYKMNPDGTGVERLTNDTDPPRPYDANPAWSPDGSKIAFQSLRGEPPNWDIYVMNGDGSGLVRLTYDPDAESWPEWSPDGSKIAFNSTRDGNAEIYVMNADGTGLVNLTNNPTIDLHPAWSPDGSKIAFSSTRQDGRGEIYVMNADGTGVVRLTNHVGVGDSQPAWSPDGSKIAFATSPGIHVMNADGTGVVTLTYDYPNAGHPDWSPDGSKIAFHAIDRFPVGFDIYVMNADGTGVVNITNNPAIDVSPDWGSMALVTPVSIDIKPGTDPNSINCKIPQAMIPVAILTTDDFDATTVDHTTVIFEGASEMHATPQGVQRHEKDVDDDGDIDLVFHFRLGETTLDCDSTEGTLTGETFDGQAIVGTDAVNMIDPGQP